MAQKASNNRRVTIMLVIGGVAIVLFAAYSMMSGGSGGDSGTTLEPTQTAIADDGHGGSPATDTPPTTAPGAPTIPNGEFDVFATRNPFEPAVEVIPDTPVTTPESTETGGTPTTPDTLAPEPGSPEPSAGTTVSLTDVFDQGGVTMATVTVGSTSYTVAAGQTFATSYKVVSLSGTCGQFLYGDSPFDLCEGEQVIK